jgi:hypothetical protein
MSGDCKIVFVMLNQRKTIADDDRKAFLEKIACMFASDC